MFAPPNQTRICSFPQIEAVDYVNKEIPEFELVFPTLFRQDFLNLAAPEFGEAVHVNFLSLGMEGTHPEEPLCHRRPPKLILWF